MLCFVPSIKAKLNAFHLSHSIRHFAAETLAKGLNAMSRPQVASALEVFHNLACLPEQTKVCNRVRVRMNHYDTIYCGANLACLHIFALSCHYVNG